MSRKNQSTESLPLEEQLLNNAVDTIVKNLQQYHPTVLIHLIQEVAQGRADISMGIYRVLTASLDEERRRDLGLGPKGAAKMVGTSDEEMNFLTMPVMHRTILRGIQQMQEKLMPGGFLLINRELDHADVSRLLAQCTTQLEKALRMTKAVKANSEVMRLKEAISAGMEAVKREYGEKESGRVLRAFSEGMRTSLGLTKEVLEEAIDEAQELGG